MKKIALFAAGIFFILTLQAQRLYFPEEFHSSIENDIRNEKGKPGKAYFVNSSSYKIQVDFNPHTAQLIGNEEIVYKNNSGDTLHQIVVKLNQNYFKKGGIRDFGANAEDIHEGVKIHTLTIDGDHYPIAKNTFSSTNVAIRLHTPILPHSQVLITFDWELTYPQKTRIRSGKYDENTFFVGYWYPQIAVYDDIFGWDRNPYTGRQEFFNDHSDYEVSITVPYPNVVWGSSRIQNITEVFKKRIIKRYEQALQSDEVVAIISKKDESKDILINTTKNTFSFKAKSIPDFSFATSDHYLWEASTLQLENRDVLISSVYKEGNGLFDKVATWAHQIIHYFSTQIPGIEFPYPSMTVFNGGGAMEYPMMVNLWEFNDNCSMIYVLAHEIGHTYFPFAAGTNETVFSWMDEGLINYFPRYAAQNIIDSCKYFENMLDRYLDRSGTYFDIPLMVPGNFVHENTSYRQLSYAHPAFAFYQLTEYLGEKRFFSSLQEFFSDWKTKHPYPYDFFNSFNQSTGENLNWFWKAYFQDFAYPDLAITDASYQDGMLQLEIENKGGLPIMTVIHLTFEDGKTQEIVEPLSIWKDKSTIHLRYTVGKLANITIGDDLHPDKYPSDNHFDLQ
jgi:hypothetical protein